jgi:hypothetical protein
MQGPVRLDEHLTVLPVDMKHNGFGQDSAGVIEGAVTSEVFEVWENPAACGAAEFLKGRGDGFYGRLCLGLGGFLRERDAFCFVHNEKPS